MKFNSGLSTSRIASSISSLKNKASSIVSNVRQHTKAILAMGMIAGGAHALTNESHTHYGSITSSSSEWSITDRDGGELDSGDIGEILGAKIRYKSELTNQQTSSYEAFIKMPYASRYQVQVTDEQRSKLESNIQQFNEGISKQLRNDLSIQNQDPTLNLEGFAKFASIFTQPTTKQSINTRSIDIIGSASFVGDHTKNQSLAHARAKYLSNLISTKANNTTVNTTSIEVGSLTDAEQAKLEGFAKQEKTNIKSLIRDHQHGKHFSGEIDDFLSQHLDERQGVKMSSDVHFSRTITQDFSLSAYWLVLAGLGITFRRKAKGASQSLVKNIGRLKGWGQKIFSRNGSAHDARERLRENLEEIRGETGDQRINDDISQGSNMKEIVHYQEPQKLLMQRLREYFGKKKNNQQDSVDDNTPLSSEIITERLKELLTQETNTQEDIHIPKINQEIASQGENEDIATQSQESESPQEPKIQPIKQDRWRPNARRAISAFDTLIEESILRSETIPKEFIERKDLLRDLMKKESWDILEREIRSIIRMLRTQHTHYAKQDQNNLLDQLDRFADDIAQRERFGRGYLGHTMSPYFVQKEIKNMRCTPIANRIQDLTYFAPTTKFDLGYGEHIYLSNRVRAADGAKNDHIAIYIVHEGKLTGYIFEESRTTGEWKLLPSKQWEHSTILNSITTQHNTHQTKSLGSLTIHSLNPEIISEIFRQPLTNTFTRGKIRQIFHTANLGSQHVAQAA